MEIRRVQRAVSISAAATLMVAAGSVAWAPASGAATITVTTTSDVVAGGDGVTSLREALAAAAGNGTTADTVVLATGATYALDECTVDGGLLVVNGGGDLTIEAAGATIEQTCTGVGVLSYGAAGTLAIHDAVITGGNCTGPSCLGGAVGVGDGEAELEIDGSTFIGNSTTGASGGGAVFAYDKGATITDTAFIGNQSVNGPSAIRSTGPLVLERSSVTGGTAVSGAAVGADRVATIRNVTIVGNTNGDLSASALFTNDLAADVEVVGSTIIGNDGPQVSIYNGTYGGNVIADPLGFPNCNHAVGASVTSLGHNRLDDETCGLTDPTDQDDVGDLGLRALFRNGGGTLSLYPDKGSVLLDAAPAETAGIVPDDQRGVTRPQGPGVDIGAIEVAECGALFTDVEGGHPFCWEIGWLSGAGVTTGFPDGGYHPGDAVSRQSMAAFMYRLAGSPRGADPTCSTAPFSDVAVDHPFCGEIDWLVDEGVTTGFEDATYRPTATVSRQSMAAFMYRLAGSPRGADPTCSTPPFSDVAVDHPFCGEIDWLVDEGVTTGFEDATYRPTATVSRQSMAAFMYRLADGLVEVA